MACTARAPKNLRTSLKPPKSLTKLWVDQQRIKRELLQEEVRRVHESAEGCCSWFQRNANKRGCAPAHFLRNRLLHGEPENCAIGNISWERSKPQRRIQGRQRRSAPYGALDAL